MRLFIAITLSENSKNLLARKRNIIKNDIKQNLKWVKVENWHLTLKFLGETREDKIPEIKEILRETSLNYYKFPIKFDGLNAFPGFKHPKVIFFDIKKGKNNLIKIHREIDASLAQIGFEQENKKYTPHLTLARSRKILISPNWQKN